jgi:hypothetical protein
MSLRLAGHSSRGVLPSVVCLSMIVKPGEWGGPGPLGTVEPSNIYIHIYIYIHIKQLCNNHLNFETFYNSLLTPSPVAQQPNSGLGHLIVEVSRSHTIRHTHTHQVGLLWTSDKLVAEAATYTTHNKHKKANIHAISVIRTRDPSNQAAADLRLRPHGHRDWLIYLSNSSLKILFSLVSKVLPRTGHEGSEGE